MMNFRTAHMSSKDGEKHRNEGFECVFCTLESYILTHSVPFPRVGIGGADGLLISYFIVSLPFR